MGTILFECPITGRPVSTGVETEPISFCRVRETWLELYCPLCERVHGATIWLEPSAPYWPLKGECADRHH
jgi:hypothetical protein